MDNQQGSQNPGQQQNPPTDKGEDAEDRRQAAEQAWNDRAGVPRGTPEQGEKKADRVGGTGTEETEPEVENQPNQSSRSSQSTTRKDMDESRESPTKKNA